MKRAAVSLVFVVGCRFELPDATNPDGDLGGDGDPCVPWVPRGGHVRDVCAVALPGDAWRVTATSATYDTEADTYSQGPSPRSTLIAIVSTGRIHAGGMGGAGANGNGGGGGGGSGGFIGLDAPVVTTATTSVLAANGGAGGAGCQTGAGASGQDGQPLNLSALGGMSSTCTNGADGGNGSKRGDAAQPGMTSMYSGGGGGGGGGYIIIWTPSFPFDSPGLRTPPEVHIAAIEP